MCLAPHTPFCHTPFHPSLASAPYSLPPHTPFRPILPSAPASRPPHAPSSSAPGSLPPQPPVRPRLPSAPASRPPQARFRPSLPCVLRACVGCQRIFTGRSQVWRRGACQLAYIDARCMRSFASAPRLIGCRVAGWHVVALVHASATASDLQQELEQTRFQVDRGSYATSSAPPTSTPTRPYTGSLHTPPLPRTRMASSS